ncbi:MAG: MarR family transcriptional regulator [Paracoccus denitrificans]|uniref:MarR family transcriptional regulator n=1 Tax=Paracoccus denitrificans TaxID=266 RepID=A0A533HXR8_PARDE|nr:MAG: MarR family transcriptional regulator [Paracoccus denitrificans]
MAKEPDYRANALIRGLAILQSFDQRHPEMSLSEIAEAISVTSSAAYRFVVTLEQEGYLEKRESRYRLAPRVMDLGYRYLGSLDIPDVARLPIDQLRNESGFSVHLGVLSGLQVVYVGRALSDRAMVSNVPVGARLPAVTTTMGRMLLCDLPEAELDRRLAGHTFDHAHPDAPQSLAQLKALLRDDRQRGYLAQPSHHAPGTFAIAAPLVSRHGHYLGAINLSGHEMELRPTPEVIAGVLATAGAISRFL